jgi:hypothetical protein
MPTVYLSQSWSDCMSHLQKKKRTYIKNVLINGVKGKSRCLFWELYKTFKYNPKGKIQSYCLLNQVVHIFTAFL